MTTFADVDLDALSRERAARLDAMRQHVVGTRGQATVDQILGNPTVPAAGGPGISVSPEERAKNMERARDWSPALANKVLQSGGDPMVTAAAAEAQTRQQTAEVIIVKGVFQGGDGVEQISSGTADSAPEMVMKVADPGTRDHTSAGSVTIDSSKQSGGPAQVTAMKVNVDANVVDSAEQGLPVDGGAAQIAAADTGPLIADGRSSNKGQTRAERAAAAAATVEAMRSAAAASQRPGREMAGP